MKKIALFLLFFASLWSAPVVLEGERVDTGITFAKGYSHETMTFTLEAYNPKAQSVTYYLEFSEPFAEVVDFVIDSEVSPNGLHVPLNARAIAVPLPRVTITFAPYQTRTLLIRYQSRFTSYGAFTLYTQEGLSHKELIYTAFYFAYFGAVAVMALYNLFLFLSLRDKSYLYYVGYATVFGLWVFLFSGFSLYFIDASWHYILHFSTPLAFAFFTRFSQNILNIQALSSRLYRLTQLFIVLLILFSVWVVWDLESGYYVTNLFGMLFFPVMAFIGVYAAKKGVMTAKLYLFSLLLYLFFATIVASLAMGLVEFSLLTKYAFVVGSLLEITLFSFLLAYKFNTLKQEHLQAQRDESMRLEATVAQKTQDLRALLSEREMLIKEIHHRVKNNLQIISGMLWLQSDASENEEVSTLLTQSIARIKSISLIHELIYASSDFAHIEAQGYFERLLASVRGAILDQKIAVESDIAPLSLSLDEAMALGVIVVEVVTNAAKHAWDSTHQSPKITLSLCPEGDKIALHISDNGKGVVLEQLQNSSTLGVNIIAQMSTRLPKATYGYSNDAGLHFHLRFEKL
ncbi:MAG: hypothetical protein KU37_09855 [Sulfuricurvum sp. PC08-66]|nr:MAG: hypothetical protein KU37_09855 [Sulfuricurvum sp. PC08-66]